ncbi:MAG: alanine racemase [Actinomycetota bacterium]|nr:alanine racemase [Actinomycetota bacterium]
MAKIGRNTQAVVEAAGAIAVFGVTKGCAGAIPVARAMLGGGARGLADSRLSSLEELRRNFPTTPLLALRQPMRFEAAGFAKLGATVIISDIAAAAALSEAARDSADPVSVLVMIEVGDEREGVAPESFGAFVEAISSLPAIKISGIAANVGCLGGREPSRESMEVFHNVHVEAGRRGLGLTTVSAGNSSCWNLLKTGQIPRGANQMRFGEAILLGVEAAGGRAIPELHQDACAVDAEILETSTKAGGRRAVAAIGCQDIGSGELYPVDGRLKAIRLTSDHCVLAVEQGLSLACGDIIQFRPSYFALQSLAASADVGQEYKI